jgi:hypothetical protein
MTGTLTINSGPEYGDYDTIADMKQNGIKPGVEIEINDDLVVRSRGSPTEMTHYGDLFNYGG